MKAIPKVGVGALVMDRQGRILLTHRTDKTTNAHNMWELPGGRVENSETIEETAIRETKEETNLNIHPIYCINVLQYFIDGQHWINFALKAIVHSGKLENKEPKKFKEIKFFSLDNLPEPMGDLTKKVIEAYKRNESIEIDEVDV